jgi:hypothetical protein
LMQHVDLRICLQLVLLQLQHDNLE